jgi:hypothetical protein
MINKIRKNYNTLNKKSVYRHQIIIYLKITKNISIKIEKFSQKHISVNLN